MLRETSPGLVHPQGLCATQNIFYKVIGSRSDSDTLLNASPTAFSA